MAAVIAPVEHKKKLSSNKPAAGAPVYESSTCPPTSYFLVV